VKILYHHRTMADGAEGIHIREIVLALRALGHDVLVVALAGDPTQRMRATTSSRLARFRRLIPAIGYEIAELGYNVVGYRRLIDAARDFKPDFVYDRYNIYSTAAACAARKADIPLLLEVNTIAYERTVDDYLRLKFPRLAERYEKRIFESADRIFAVSAPLKTHLTSRIHINAAKIIVLPNGADPDVFTPSIDGTGVRRRFGIHGSLVVGFVGILRPWHGVDLLLDAFQQLRSTCSSAHLLIVGDGPIQDQLAERSRVLGVSSHVTFTGRLSHQEVIAHIAAMDLAVSPHATFYASPMKILEYMAMAKAIVAPALDNIRDILSDGETGFLFEPGSSSALAAAMRRLAEDGTLRRRLGEKARHRVIEQFNWRRNAACIVQEAAALLQHRVSPRHIA